MLKRLGGETKARRTACQHQDQRIGRRLAEQCFEGAPLITNCVLRSKNPSGRSIFFALKNAMT